jgi:hypothetical protein
MTALCAAVASLTELLDPANMLIYDEQAKNSSNFISIQEM